MKKISLVLLLFAVMNNIWAQGVTKNGKITTTGTEFVDKNGGVGRSQGVDKNGKIVSSGLAIGDSYQGGKIFYIYKLGDPEYVAGRTKGLITATAAVVSNIGSVDWNAAVSACANLSVTDNGTIYDDWYLPSKDQWTELWLNKIYAGSYYGWSSSPGTTNPAFVWAHNGVKMIEMSKTGIPAPVLPVRSFAVAPLDIGDFYQGGKIAYFFVPGDPGYVEGEVHGLIAAPSDQATGTAAWGCWSFKGGSLGAAGLAIGTGKANTDAIVANCSDAGIAAKLCAALTLGGYTDWYLPSKDELNKLYINRIAIGGFTTVGNAAEYLSSSEFISGSPYIGNVWGLVFGANYQETTPSKVSTNPSVRAVRTF